MTPTATRRFHITCQTGSTPPPAARARRPRRQHRTPGATAAAPSRVAARPVPPPAAPRRRIPALMPVLAGALLFLTLTGCAVGPDYRPPNPPELPAQFAGALDSSAPLTNWWTTFQDPLLTSLIQRALATNHNLRLATLRLREARALQLAAAGELLPIITGNAALTTARRSENLQNFPNQQLRTETWQAGFDARWEIDIFGGRRRALQAATAALASLEEQRRDVQISLTAEVARHYYELRGAQYRLQLTRDIIATLDDARQLARARADVGLTGELPAAQAEALLANARAALPALETARQLALHRLGILLGRAPTALADELAAPAELPAAVPAVPVGLPGELLRRRPDVRRAERDLAVATALTGVAVAELYPKFYLTGLGNLESLSFDDWFSARSRHWSAGPSLRWRILDFARVRAEINAQTARQQQALVAYEQTVLDALAEVEDALAVHHQGAQRRQALETAVASHRRQLQLAEDLYANGLTDFLTVLDARRSWAAATEALAEARAAEAVQLVAVYKALGGGWE